MIEETLAHYRIKAKLGSGAMGDVYRAEDSKLGREVAIKLLPEETTADVERLRRFEQEARAASALNHPNIVHIYEVGEHGLHRYIAMELVSGKTLRELVEEGPLEWKTLCSTARQLAAGLAKAHEAGIVHRDLKPENVMLTEDGYVKILDFGLAKIAKTPAQIDSEIATLEQKGTTPGTILGTVGNMSPEQARGEPADPRSDQFSLGTLLYELSSGRNPFVRPTAVQTLSAVIEAAPPPLASLNPAVPNDFCAIVERCLAKEKGARFESTKLLAEALTEVSERPTPRPTSPAAARHTVGREAILQNLKNAWRSVESTTGALLSIAGEAGIGKTTVVETFLDELKREKTTARMGRGRCSERLAGTEAYLPFFEALESLLRAEPSLARVIGEIAPTWYLQLKPDSSGDAGGTRASSQERMKRELSSFLERLSHEKPLLLFIEDLHWADASTVDLLAHLADRFDAVRALVLATYRPEELRIANHPFLDVRSDLQARGSLREIQLDFLSKEDIESFLSLEFPAHELPEGLSSVIHQKTEGSPLFMADLLRYLRDKRVLVEEAGVWRLATSVPDIESDLPQSVRGMIERKVERLDPSDRRLLSVASVQGVEFHASVVAEVSKEDPLEVEERLEELGQVHALLASLEPEDFPDGTFSARYRFVHGLYQNVLEAMLPPSRRASWSRAVAENLIGHFGDRHETMASELAVLFETARDKGRAAQYYAVAARNAAKVFAYHEAIALARRGLELVRGFAESEERTARELELEMALGPALVSTRGYAVPEVGETFARARELCRHLGETPQRFPVLHGLFRYYFVRSDVGMMEELAEEILRLAQASGEPRRLVPAHRAVGSVHLHVGRLALCKKHLEEGFSLNEPEYQDEFLRLYGQNEGLACVLYLTWCLWMMGYPEQAASRLDESLELARRQTSPYVRAHILAASAMYHSMWRRPEASLRTAEETIALAGEHGFGLWVPWATKISGWALAALGEREKGIRLAKAGSEGWLKAGATMGEPLDLAMLAEAHLAGGELDEGLGAIERALGVLDHGRYWEAEVHRLEGELRARKGDPNAEACFHRALEVSRKQEAKSFELRAAMSLGRFWNDRGKATEARKLLGSVYGWFTEGFDTPDLLEAKTLLASVEE